MKIFNVRLGLATNSSSSHSIVMIRKPSFKSKFVDSPDALEGDFNWNYFTAASLESKSLYLAALIRYDLEVKCGKDIADAVIQGWLGVNLENKDANIDHQSFLEIPFSWDGKGPDKQFLMEFKDFILRDDIAILGGNDNEEKQHNLVRYSNVLISRSSDSPKNQVMFRECGGDEIVCRKDDSGYWTIFNRSNGTKLRFSMDPAASIPTKATSPELVDIKITDYCPFNCSYCYQDSTLKGKHASLNSLEHLAEILGEMKVFEVALGGGEPTLHPDFVKVLGYFRSNGIVPNFTTKSLGWLKDDKLREDILKVAGNFAYSCETENDVLEFAKLCSLYGLNKGFYDGRAVVHYIPGIGSEDNFKKVLTAACDNTIEITLLGYKTNGRGALFNQEKSFDWISSVKDISEHKYLKLGIDTKLALEYEEDIKKANISDCLYYTQEGKFSMYIDAVKGIIGPSSYCDNKEMSLLELSNNFDDDIITIKNHFQSF